MRCNKVLFLILILFCFSGCGGEQDYTDGDIDTEGGSSADTDAEDDLPDGDVDETIVEDGDISETDEKEVYPDGDISEDDEEEATTIDGDEEWEDLESETEVSDAEPENSESEEELETEIEEDAPAILSCGFTYEQDFVYSSRKDVAFVAGSEFSVSKDPLTISYPEPKPQGYRLLKSANRDTSDIVLPDYADDMPLFQRATEWDTDTRCYEFPTSAELLTESEAFDLYAEIIRKTLWKEVNLTTGFRTVVGIRGAYPGTFEWHGNLPNRFNDTLVLMWIDEYGSKHLREFPVNTDTGAFYSDDENSSSSLRGNRHYYYKNGLHSGYSALVIYTQYTYIYYPVRDDSNFNGHWDSDRNGWFPPDTGDDYDRYGNGHNIHMGSKYAPLGTAGVNNWSAGCQVIPGMSNWYEFIVNAWTGSGDAVDYFLIDARDISLSVWNECPEELGTHACPYKITGLPYEHQGDTRNSNERMHDYYNCSTADERGSEVVYVINIDDTKMQDTGSVVYESGLTLSVSVEVDNEELYDPDIHLLSGDDQDACIIRNHRSFTHETPPGRYLIVVDTFVNENNEELSGPYTLKVDSVD